MCDEYEDERIVAFWRKLEELDRNQEASPEDQEVLEPLVRTEPDSAATPKAKPKSLVH